MKRIFFYAAIISLAGCTSTNANTGSSENTAAIETAAEEVVDANLQQIVEVKDVEDMDDRAIGAADIEVVHQLAPGEPLPSPANMPVVIDFFATWCGPCRNYGPVFDQVASEMQGKAKFIRVDVDENNELAGVFNISSIPTTVVLKANESPKVMVGMLSADQLRALIAK